MSGIAQALFMGSAGISFVGSFYNDGSGASSTTITANYGGSLSGGSDSSPREGDYVFVAVCTSNSADLTFSASTAGYTKVADLYANNTGTTADCSMAVFYKRMGASPDSSVTITSSATAFLIATVYVVRGMNASTPMDATATTATTVTNGAVPDPPAITPATARAAVLAVGCAAGSGTMTDLTSSDLANFDSRNTGFAATGIGLIYGWASGAVNPAAFGGGGASLRATASVTMALRPA